MSLCHNNNDVDGDIEVLRVMPFFRHILVGVITLVAAGVVRGDFMPLAADHPAALPSRISDVEPLVDRCAFADSGFSNLDVLPVRAFADTQTGIEHGEEAPSPLVLGSEDGSVNLCFYGLLSLGLFRMAVSAKLLSLSVVCACCHNGSLYHTDYSLTLSRDCPVRAPAYCYAPIDGRGENAIPRFRQNTILALLRQSQCAPTAQSLRGPPYLVS